MGKPLNGKEPGKGIIQRKDGLYPFFVVALGTGMRMGEILGLTWDCVDKVQKTLCCLPNDGVALYEFHPPKIKAGKRGIPMIKEVKSVLLEQKIWKEHIAVRHNPRVGMEKLVLFSKTNNPIKKIRSYIRNFTFLRSERRDNAFKQCMYQMSGG